MILSILFTILLVFLNGFFVAAEFAIVKVRKSKLEILSKEGSKIAPYSQDILKHLDSYLSATQLGITLASLGLGWVGEPIVARVLIKLFTYTNIKVDAHLIDQVALVLGFVIITILHIIFGELAPKSLAIKNPEKVTLNLTLPLKFFYILFRPFIWALNKLANFILNLMGIPIIHGNEYHSAEELLMLLEQGRNTGAIAHSEHELIKNVFQFNERSVKQIMVPRTQIVAIEFPITNKELVDTVTKEGYSRMPVFTNTIDNIIGVIFAKDLLNIIKHKENFALKEILRPAYFVPETQKISDLLQQFQRQHIHLAIVLDEFGGTAGMVTLEDIIEELVGEIQDEYDEEKPTVERIKDNEWAVNAHAAITDVNENLEHPLPEDDDYDTVAGMMNVIFKKIPDVGEKARFGGYEFTIMKKSKRSVQLIKIKLLPAPEKPENSKSEKE